PCCVYSICPMSPPHLARRGSFRAWACQGVRSGMERAVIREGAEARWTAPRIWDLRRGDYDDDRTSPRVHGLRRIMLARAFDFNYLKALLGFLTLIVGPALLIGVAPSVVLTLGRLKFETVTSVASRPIFALVLLVVLVGLALWIGRPLVRLAV